MRRPLKLLTKAIAIETAIEYAAHAAMVPSRLNATSNPAPSVGSSPATAAAAAPASATLKKTATNDSVYKAARTTGTSTSTLECPSYSDLPSRTQ